MASQKRKKADIKRAVTSVISALVLIAAGIITFVDSDKVPNWNDIFTDLGLADNKSETIAEFSVHFIDVGQGDCTLIKSGGRSMLIDSGESGNDKTVLDYLEKEKITKLDYVVITHMHTDHMGSMAKILQGVEVDNIIMSELNEKNTPTGKAYENLLNVVSQSGARVLRAKAGDTYTLADAVVEILGPVKAYTELNNTSVVMRVVYKSTSFLFTGDAEKQAEDDIISSGANVNSDVLKVGHHGSDTSTSKDFLTAVSPGLAVISCGKDNSYGHPNEETIRLLNEYGVNIKRTDENGNIVVISNGENISVSSER